MAQMYCYGWDYNCVGITGIRGCIGCVYVGQSAIYAIHIPPQTLEKQQAGAAEFANYVLHGPDKKTGTEGQLHVFVNGKNRNEAEEEARALRSKLNQPVTKVYRIMKHLGPKSGTDSADAVSILVKRVASSLNMTYKHVPDDNWDAGGKEKIGCYDKRFEGSFGDAVVPNDAELANGWHQVDASNCSILQIR
jgi:hypothetical protein